MPYVDGLNVELYQGINFDSLVATNIEETINLDDSYDTGDGDEWSIRAQGEIQAYATGTNRWYTLSDDRVRVWINGELAVNNPTDHPQTYDLVTATGLTSGQWYSIKIEFAENTEVGRLALRKYSPYTQLVPKEQLRFNTSAPTFQSAATSTDGTKVVLTYDKALSYEEASDWASATSSTTAATSDFAVTTDGSANTVTAVAVSGSTVELTLTNTVKTDQTVTVAYTDPTSGNDANAVQDTTGNDAASLSSTSVTNNSTEAAPLFSSAATSTDGTKVILTYDEALDSTTAATSDFEVTTDGSANAVTAVAVSGSTVELTLTNTVKNDQAVTVAYTDPTSGNDANAVQDSAGNDAASLSSTSVTNNSTVAGTAPTFSSAATNSAGTKVVLTYDEALDSTTAATSDFAVTTDGSANAVTAVAISGSTVELTLTNTVKNDQAVTVAYTDPTSGNDANAVQDSSGNDAASLSSTSVTNNSTVAGTAPTFSSAATNSAGTKVVLTYNEALDSTTAATSDFAVTTDGSANAVTAVAISGSTVELTLTNTVKNDEAVTVAYTDPTSGNDANAVQDSSGNDAASLSSTSVTNNSTVAGTAPTFSSAATNSAGTKVVLTYNEALDSTTAATSDFAVTTDGSANAVTAVAISGSTVELTITRAIASWQTVTVAYTDPTSGNDANAVQDSGGNDAASLTSTSVTNNSTQKFAQLGSKISGDTSSDFFGRAVSLSNDGTIIAVGASNGAGDGATSGHVQIYAWNSGTSSWDQRGSTINGENNGDLFGEAVAISGDGTIVAIGASKHDKNGILFGERHGYVQIYKWDGSSWNQRGSDLEGEARVDLFGASLSLSDDGKIVVIGASSSWETSDPPERRVGYAYPDQLGYSRIYKWDGSSWNQLGADLDGTTDGDQAGEAVAISGDGKTIAVGSFKSDSNGTDSGHTRIYRWNDSVWGALGSDIIGEAAGDEGGGTGLALSEDGTIVAIGAIKNTGGGTGANTGHTRIYQWNSGTSSWDQLGDDIDGETTGDLSGRSVALSSNGTVLAISAIENDGGGSNSGHVRIYRLVSGSWVKTGEDIDGLSANDETGLSISLSEDGNTLAVGSGSSADYVRIFDLRLDVTAPTFSSAATNSDGTKVVLTYNEALSSTTAATSAFAVTTDGAANAVTAVAVSGSTVELTLTNTVKNDQAVNVAYTDPSGSNDSNAVQDSAGNDAASLSSTSVTNNSTVADTATNNSTVAGTAPTFSSAATNSAGTKVVLTYNESLDSTTAATSAFAVTTDGAANAVTAVAVSGSTVELTLTNTVKNDQAVTVAYTDPSGSNDANAVQDSAGNDAASLSSTSVTNNSTVAGTAPTFSSAATNSAGTKVVLTYNEALDSTTAATSDFAVTTDGAANAVTAVAVSGSTVELTLTNTVKNDQAVTVAYSDPSGNDANAVQDSSGNDAASLSSTSVTNNSTVDGRAPALQSAATNSAGTKVVLTYNEALSSTTATTSDFTVTADGIKNDVKSVDISGSSVFLSLSTTIKQGQTIKLNYDDPTNLDDSNAIQDKTGNDALSLTDEKVINKSTIPAKKLICDSKSQTTKVNRENVSSGYLYGIDDDNQIFEINPKKKTTSKIFDTKLPNPKKSNGVAYHKASGSLLFFYEQTLYSWDTTSRALTQHKFKEGKTASAAIYGDSLWWIKSNSNQLYQLDIGGLNNGTIITGTPTKYLLDKYTKAGFGDIAISSDGILYGSATGGQIKRGGFFSFDLQSIINSGKNKINIQNHGYKQCGKTEWEHGDKKIPIGMQLALSADEKVLYGQTHQNQSAQGLDTTGQYFVFQHKDSDGRFTHEIDYADYQQSHNQLDGVGFRDIGGAATDALGEIDEVEIVSFVGASGAETNGKDINRKLNPHLKYSIKFSDALKKEQKLVFINKSKGSQSSVARSDTRLNEEITFISNKKRLNKSFKHDGDTVIVPKGISEFEMAIDIIDDKEIEGDESLTLAIDGYPDLEPATATIIDNDNSCNANLIQNGDFEQVKSQGSRQWWKSKDIPGWILENQDGEIWRSGFKGITDKIDGNKYYAELDATRKFNALSQTVQTEVGGSYTLKFDLHRRSSNRDETVVVGINDVAANSHTANKWLAQSLSFIADSNQTTIRFSELEKENDSYGGLIDNVSLTKDCGRPFTPKKIEDVQHGNGAEVNKQQGENDINFGKNDFLSYSFSFNEELERIQTLDLSLDFASSTANQDDIKGSKAWIFKADQANHAGLVFNDDKLTIPRGVKTVEVQIPVFDDKLVEDKESLTLNVGEKSITASIEDNEQAEAEVERILVARDNAREFSSWDYKHKGLNILHKDYIAYYVELKESLNKDTTLNFKQVFNNGERDANKKDIELRDSQFWVDDQENFEFRLRDGQLTIPAGVKRFEARLPVYDDKIIEGTEFLTLQAGSQEATAKILDNDFVKLKAFKGADGAEIDVLNDDDPNKGLNPYLLYTVRLQAPVRQAQKFNITQSSTSTANDADLDLQNQKIKFNITKFNQDIPNAKENSSISQQTNGTIWIPIGTKEFTAKLPIKDDSIIEGSEDLTLSLGGFNATAYIKDNDFNDININSFHAGSSNGAEKTQGFKRSLSYSLTFDEKLKKQQTLSFAQLFPESQSNVDENDVYLDQIKFKSNIRKKDKEFLLNNGQLVVPRGISSFKAEIKIVDDTIVEDTEELTLSVANHEATASVTDNDVAVGSFHATKSNGAELTKGYNNFLSYSLTFDEKLKKKQYLTFSQSLLPSQSNVDEKDVLLGKYISFISNKPKKDKKFSLNDGLLAVPKGITSFTTNIEIIDDSIVEGEEFLTLSLADKKATASIVDNDFEDVKVDMFHANNSNGAERTEGFNDFLSYYLEFEEELKKDQNLSFTQSILPNLPEVSEQDVLLGANITFFSNDQSKDEDFFLNNGILSVPSGVSSFTAKIEIVDDEIVESKEYLTLSVAGQEATAAITDNDFHDAKVISFDGYTGAETNSKDENSRLNPYLKYTIGFSETLKKDQSIVLLNKAVTAQSVEPNVDTRLQEQITFKSNNKNLDHQFKRAGNLITVPKGVERFDVIIDIIDDALVEGDEELTLFIEGYDNLSASATIIDNDPVEESTYIESISSPTVVEGDGNKLVYNIELNRSSTASSSYAFTVSGDAIGAPIDIPNQVDYLNAYNVTLSNGVTNNGDGTITIPTGIESFSASVPVIDDNLIENTEQAILSIGTRSGTGQIFDNDPSPARPTPNPNPSDQSKPTPAPSIILIDANAVREGDGTNLRYNVQLNRAASTDLTFAFGVSGDAIGGPVDTTTAVRQIRTTQKKFRAQESTRSNHRSKLSKERHTAAYLSKQVDYLTADNAILTNGVINNGDGSITIPAGVQSFSASVPVIDDSLIENTETAILSIGSHSGIGQIFDNDSPPTSAKLPPSVTLIDSNSVTEGDDSNLLYTIQLDRASSLDTTFTFTVAGDAVGASKNIHNQVDYLNAGNVLLSNGVMNNGDGSITIPAGVQSFTASIPVIDDSLIENTETAILSIGENSGIGQIFDNDSLRDQNRPGSRPAPILTNIKANTALEGANEDLVYRVSFDRRHQSSRHYQFEIGGDAGFGVDYLTGKNVVITNGVASNNEGSITVPKGVKNFDVHVPVVDDNIIESTEIASIQIGRHQGIGQILDNDRRSKPSTPEIKITNLDEGADIYLLLDTSTSMLQSDNESGSDTYQRLQSIAAMRTFVEAIERTGYQFQNNSTEKLITGSEFIDRIVQLEGDDMTNILDDITLVDSPRDSRIAQSVNVHLITYDYAVDHDVFRINSENSSDAITIVSELLNPKSAHQAFGNSIKGNELWESRNLPRPNSFDLHQGNADEPSNLYSGTEMLGALEGLEFRLGKQFAKTKGSYRNTYISLITDGRPERRSWWDTRVSPVSDSIVGAPISLPNSLGGEEITTSGLLYDAKGAPHYMKNNNGDYQWKTMQKDLNKVLDDISNVLEDPEKQLQVQAIGIGERSHSELSEIHKDLFGERIFDNKNGGWSYSSESYTQINDLI